ncbi:MAG TPA: nucleoside monophosphate kinase [Candidatus Saccharimonadales bacterium]
MHIEKKHIITIAGKPGSGKSTASKALADKLGYAHFSSGDYFRSLSKDRGVTVLEANLAGEKGAADLDELVDQRLRDINTNEDQLSIDSRTAWHWIPTSYKVYLDLDLYTAAQRVLGKMTPERIEVEHIPNDPDEYAHQLQQRLDSEARRYQKFYGINPYDTSNYDLVVDTKVNSPEQVLDIIYKGYQDWLNS